MNEDTTVLLKARDSLQAAMDTRTAAQGPYRLAKTMRDALDRLNAHLHHLTVKAKVYQGDDTWRYKGTVMLDGREYRYQALVGKDKLQLEYLTDTTTDFFQPPGSSLFQKAATQLGVKFL